MEILREVALTSDPAINSLPQKYPRFADRLDLLLQFLSKNKTYPLIVLFNIKTELYEGKTVCLLLNCISHGVESVMVIREYVEMNGVQYIRIHNEFVLVGVDWS